MNSDLLRIGGHISFTGNLLQTLQQNSRYSCLQLCLGPPQTYSSATLTSSDISACQQYCLAKNKNFYVHCPFVANLAKDSWLPSQQVIEKELRTISSLPAACVLHIGRVGTMANVKNHLSQLTIPSSLLPRSLLLENAAGQGTELGRDWDQLRQLFEGIDKSKIGLCIDTQHAFAAGIQSWSDPDDVALFFDRIEEIGTSLDLLHLNDSARPFASCVDRHESLGKGYIWKNDTSGLKELLSRCCEEEIDIVLETSNPDEDINFINGLGTI